MATEFQNQVPGSSTDTNGPAVDGEKPGHVTPIPDMEFVALWSRPELSSADIAEQLDIGVRAANKRAHYLGLPAKGVRPKKVERLRSQLLEAAMPATDGKPDPRLPWLSDPDIRPVFEAYWAGLKGAETGEALVRLRPLQLKIHAMVAAKYPWAMDAIQTLAESVKLLLAVQKAEANLPVRPDYVQLRQDAARQLMAELGSVLTEEEKDQMGRLLQLAADRMVERRRLAQMGTGAPPSTPALPMAMGSASANPW